MSRLVGYFARGALAVVPMAATIYILYAVVRMVDSLVGVSVPGLGIALALGLITLVGFLVTGVIGRQIFKLFDKLMARVPLVRLLYTSIRDLIGAVMGEERKFGQPVRVSFGPDHGTQLLGFLSQETMAAVGLPEHVAVYVPQAYNIGGQVLLVPKESIQRVNLPPSTIFAFLLSGGAAGLAPAALSTLPPPRKL